MDIAWKPALLAGPGCSRGLRHCWSGRIDPAGSGHDNGYLAGQLAHARTGFTRACGGRVQIILGAPVEVFLWTGAITAYIGMLTHCNIEMRFGILSYIFNTPGLHRWHHSMDIREGNMNYGENLMLWDFVFKSFLNPDRPPPSKIGIHGDMPASFIGQLKHPFISKE